MREHGFCFQQTGQTRAKARGVTSGADLATPRKGRRPRSVLTCPWPGLLERLCVVAPVFSGTAMSDQPNARLIQAVRELTAKARRLLEQHRGGGLGEQNT